MYDFAVSYCSEDINYVKNFVDILIGKNYSVFFDRYEYKRLVFTYLHEELYKIFTQESKIIILFISQKYLHNPHTKWEARSVIAKSVFDEVPIFVIKCDNVSLDEIDKELCINKNYLFSNIEDHNPKEMVELILKKLQFI